MKVIVVGGGIMGAVTAWELAQAGADVTLFEARELGCESTGKSAAIVRMHYSNPEVVRMAVHSREAFRRLPLLLECDPVYTRCGWLFLVEESEAELAFANAQMQDEEGVDIVEVDDLQEYVPGIDEEGIAYALFEPDSGFADPVAATRAYADAARRLGAEVHEHSPVRRLADLREQADVVVLAAGAWSANLAAAAGIDLPVEIYREQDVVFDVAGEETIRHAISSQVDRVYMRPDGNGLLAGRGYPKEYERVKPDGYDASVDDDFTADVHERVTRRIPRLAAMHKASGRTGLYTVTPDWHPLLGPVPGDEWLVLATGGSGHCFKLGPAIGSLVANAILGRQLKMADVETFSLARFAGDRLLRSTYGGNRA